jgi:hypothetical protein
MTEIALQAIFEDVVASVSFRDAPQGTVAMVETWTADEA